jgi:hypothetical protein
VLGSLRTKAAISARSAQDIQGWPAWRRNTAS